MNAQHQRTETPEKHTPSENLLCFIGQDPRRNKGEAVSECNRYSITWADQVSGIRYYNAWFGDAPRKHLSGTFSLKDAKAACDAHHAKYFPPVQKTYSTQPQQQQVIP